MRARHAAWMALLTISASCCAGGWSVRAWMETAPGGMLVFAIALAGLFFAADLWREAMKYLRLSNEERRWEREREPMIRL